MSDSTIPPLAKVCRRVGLIEKDVPIFKLSLHREARPLRLCVFAAIGSLFTPIGIFVAPVLMVCGLIAGLRLFRNYVPNNAKEAMFCVLEGGVFSRIWAVFVIVITTIVGVWICRTEDLHDKWTLAIVVFTFGIGPLCYVLAGWWTTLMVNIAIRSLYDHGEVWPGEADGEPGIAGVLGVARRR
jgi:hypothetical protein